MAGLLAQNSSPTQAQIVDALDGNLCRCTGYRPIVAAFTSFGSDYVNVQEHTKGRCCGSVRDCIPDIEELGVVTEPKYRHSEWAKPVVLPKVTSRALRIEGSQGNSWIDVTSLTDLYSAVASAPPSYSLVVGQTSSGIYPMPVPKLYINILNVKELYGFVNSGNGIVIGAAETLQDVMNFFLNNTALSPKMGQMASFMKRIASFNIRNVASWAGNLVLANTQNFASDLFTMFSAAGGVLTIADATQGGTTTNVPCGSFMGFDMTRKVIRYITIPLDTNPIMLAKTALRHRFAHCYVNVGATCTLQADKVTIATVSITMAGLPGAGKRMAATEAALTGKNITQPSVLAAALAAVLQDVGTLPAGTAHPKYRAECAQNFVYKFLLQLQPSLPSSLRSAVTPFKRAVSTGHQTYQNPGDPSENPISYPVPKLMEKEQTCGKVTYTDDEPLLPGTLFAAPVYSSVAVADVVSIDASDALSMEGVVAFYAAKDLPNPSFKWGPLSQDEPLFASTSVVCYGQLLGLVVATSQLLADMGSRLVQVQYSNQGTPIVDIDQAVAANSYFPGAPAPITVGDVDSAFGKSDLVFEGTTRMGSQIHMNMEPQCVYVIPEEADTLKIIGTFQWQGIIQQTVSALLNIPQGKITVYTRRLGGGYGSKITRAAGLSAAIALAATKLGRPVKMSMRIEFQNDMWGKRNQYRADYKIGVQKTGVINAIQVKVFQQGGAFFDFDNFSMGACITSINNCYTIPNWSIESAMCKTNLAAQTSVRGPGWSAGVYIAEAMLEDVAAALGMDPLAVKTLNLSKPGDMTPYKQPLPYFPIADMTTQLLASSNWTARVQEIDAYNAANQWTKRGIAYVPSRFNVNNSIDLLGCLMNVFSDGTVQISTGGLEMGQGLNTKVAQAAAMVLGIPISSISVTSTNTLANPNNSPSGGSITSEVCVVATMNAAKAILALLAPFKTQQPQATWPQLCLAAIMANVDLRAATHADIAKPTTPDSYQTYGVCVLEMYLDLLTGEYEILQADLLVDLGISMNPLLDVGQTEGAFMMGLGLNLMEEVRYDEQDGSLLTNDTWEYKIPGVMDIPINWNVTLLKNAPNPVGVLRSKAVGEPPLTMGCAANFALRYAINAARAAIGKKGRFVLDSPCTPSNVLDLLVAEGVVVPGNMKLQ